MREPRAEGPPSRCGAAPTAGLLSAPEDWRAGVSRTSLRNWELFIAALAMKVLEIVVCGRCEMRLGNLDGGLSLVLG